MLKKLDTITKHNHCPVCDSKGLKPLIGYEQVPLVSCSSCGFVCTSKIPSDDELKRYYSHSYDRTSYFSPVTRKRYEELLASFEKYRITNRILDIGCGYGFFLEVAKEKGWEVYGSELSAEAASVCREKGITVCEQEVTACDFEPESFDVIVSIEVIEHLHHPKIYVERAYQLLRKGGLFYLTTPNFNAYLRYRLKEKYDIIEYPNHLSYFTQKTLRKLFEACHFETVSIKSSGMSITRYRTSKGISNQDFVSETSDDEMIRFQIEKKRSLRMLRNATNGVLNLFKIGMSLKGTFRK